MSQTAIPLEFEQYLQNKVSLKQPTDLNEIIFAMIPDLDLSQPIDRTVSLPPLEQWVFQQDVDQIGKSGSNAVVYSVVIPGSTEPFTFNAMFMRDKNVPKSCGMVVYKATETKETGMALTKSMLMQFDGAAAAANVTVDAATWQIDYQARLKGMDEDHRLSCLDNYGHTAFVDGFDVTRHEIDQTKYLIAPGVAYVGGLRIQNAISTVQTVDSKPTTLWVDVYRDGTALSKYENLFQIVVTTDDLVDYTDNENRPHYVAKLARIEVDGSIVDLRVKGGLALAEMKINAAKNVDIDAESSHEKHIKLPQLWRAFANKVKDASLKVKGIVQLSSALDSDSESVAATAKVIKTLNDKLTLGFSHSFGPNGHIVFPQFLSGLIIQWGVGSAGSSLSSGYWNTLPISFPASCIYTSGIHVGGNPSGTNVIVCSKETSRVLFKSNYTGTIPVIYIAVGY